MFHRESSILLLALNPDSDVKLVNPLDVDALQDIQYIQALDQQMKDQEDQQDICQQNISKPFMWDVENPHLLGAFDFSTFSSLPETKTIKTKPLLTPTQQARKEMRKAQRFPVCSSSQLTWSPASRSTALDHYYMKKEKRIRDKAYTPMTPAQIKRRQRQQEIGQKNINSRRLFAESRPRVGGRFIKILARAHFQKQLEKEVGWKPRSKFKK
jgi:hypothetical protein